MEKEELYKYLLLIVKDIYMEHLAKKASTAEWLNYVEQWEPEYYQEIKEYILGEMYEAKRRH